MAFVKKHINLLIALAFSAWGLYLRYVTLRNRAFEGDDLYQYNCMAGDFKPFWLFQKFGDFSSFPGEYVLNYFPVHWFGPNKWGLAIPHILVTIAGFFLLYALCRRYVQSWVGYAVAFGIFALNTNLVFHSFEFRPYAVLPVLALSSLWLAHRYADQGGYKSRAEAFWSGLLIVVIVNYHIYGIALFALPLLYAAVVHFLRLRKLPPVLPILPVSIVALGIWAYYASYNHFGAVHNSFQPAMETFLYIPNPMEKPVGFLKAVFANLIGFRAGYILLVSLIIAPLTAAGKRAEQLLFFGILVVLPILLILYADIKSQYWFIQRQFIWVMPFFAILLGSQWDTICRFKPPRS